MPREIPKSCHQLFISAPNNRAVRLNNVPASGRPNTASASGRCAPSPRMGATCPRSNTARWSSTVVKLVSVQQSRDRTRPTQGPIESSKGLSHRNSDRTHPVTCDLMHPVSGPTITSCAQPVNTDQTLTSASGHSMTSVRSVFFSEKHFRDFATFSNLTQMC
jgi:hypothetical protein